jgi:predicted ATPase
MIRSVDAEGTGRLPPEQSVTTSLTRFHVAGFRSLRSVTLEPTPVTVLIGPNGAGKSNLLWALEMTRMLAFESLQRFVGERGGASFLMHYGPRRTAAVDLALAFRGEGGEHAYEARLGYGADESLLFLSERAGHREKGADPWHWTSFGAGHRESALAREAEKDLAVKTVQGLLRQINFYHFHDTSGRSPLRTRSYADTSGAYLRSDGSNLPAFLLGLKESPAPADHHAWQRIQGLIRRVAPFLRELAPTSDRRGAMLEWVDDQGEVFGPAHLSDGTLRAIALLAALGQPDATMPLVSCIDEPELGLHPAALSLLCGLMASVSSHRQVIVSTQSPAVLDQFEPGHVVVAERVDGATQLTRLNETDLASWLEDYSLSELYDKNVLGGRP